MNEFKKGMGDISAGQVTMIGICYLFLSVTTAVGNALVIAAVCKDPLKMLRSSPTNLILLSLAIADLLAGLVLTPGAGLWYLRLAMKKDPWDSLLLVMTLSGFFLIVSVCHIALLTVDRYFALAKPLKYRVIVTKRRVAVASLSIWTVCIGYALLWHILQERLLLLWFVYFLVIVLFSKGISCLYLATIKYLCKHYQATTAMDINSQSNLVLLYQRERKVFVVILSVILVFYLCFVPWLIQQLLFFFCRGCHAQYRAMMVWYHVATLLLFVNSALNPLLYSWRFSKFRATFKYFWTKCRCQKGRGRRKTISITEGRQLQESYDTRL